MSYPPRCRRNGKRADAAKSPRLGRQPSGMRNLNRLASTLLTAIVLVEPAVAQGLPGDFVYLRDIDPSIIQDIRYAGVNNFMGRPMNGYGAAECVVKRKRGTGPERR